ncbi:MAG: hypothetical protein OZ919_03100 [Xanthomonadaceae bacterium]|nr:hypothetical protein [Xanthomonadaceae bacterium]
MHAHPFDPYVAQRRSLWRNRVARWRQVPAESAFHAAIWLALAALSGAAAAALAGRRDLADAILALIQAAPWAWLLAWGGLIAMRVRLRLGDWEIRDAHGWLGAQPVAARVRRRERGRVVLGCIAPHALAGALLFAFLRLPWAAWGWLGLMLVIAPAAGVAWARRRRPCAERATRAGAGDAAGALRHFPGRGCLWRWQIREALAGIGPRALRHGLWMLLLIPVGASALGAALALASGLLLAAYLTAWRRGLAVLLEAERWLGAQPARARFWLSGLIVPLALALLGAGVAGFALAALGAVRTAPWIGAALFAVAMLHGLCALALRRTPGRIAPALVLHLTVLGAAWQAFAPLLAPLWLAMCLRLLHRGTRA